MRKNNPIELIVRILFRPFQQINSSLSVEKPSHEINPKMPPVTPIYHEEKHD